MSQLKQLSPKQNPKYATSFVYTKIIITHTERAKLVTLFSCSSSALRDVINSILVQGACGAFQIRAVQSKEPVIKNPFLDHAKQDMESS